MFDPSRFYRAPEVIRESNAPREMVYADLASGRLKAIRRGRVWLIPGACAAEWVQRLGVEP